MKDILQKLYEYQSLSREEAKETLSKIAKGNYKEEQIVAFLCVFKMRNITVAELQGFRDCMRENCISIDLSEYDSIDLCGTGGDGKNTFNISTLAAFVVAGAGYAVAKHGNYGVSSISGSSNVLEYLGYTFKQSQDAIKLELSRANITFLHAPLFHPAMKVVGTIRKNLGIATFFNMLGPMVNPSLPQKQLIGVYSLQLLRYYKYIYEVEPKQYRIVHSLDGYDELSLTNDAKIISPQKEYILSPTTFVAEKINATSLYGGATVKDAAIIFKNVLQNEGTPAQEAVVCANAAMAIQCFHPHKALEECYLIARESLHNGKAFNSFQKLIQP